MTIKGAPEGTVRSGAVGPLLQVMAGTAQYSSTKPLLLSSMPFPQISCAYTVLQKNRENRMAGINKEDGREPIEVKEAKVKVLMNYKWLIRSLFEFPFLRILAV